MDSMEENCEEEERTPCNICVSDCLYPDMKRIEDCGCSFSLSYMPQHVDWRAEHGMYSISCPDHTTGKVEAMTDKAQQLMTTIENN